MIRKILHYTSLLDILSITVASTLSVLVGTTVPLVFAVIALAINEYTQFITASTLASLNKSLSIVDHFCLNQSSFNYLDDYLFSSDPNGLIQAKLLSLSYVIYCIGVFYLLGTAISIILWSHTAVNLETRIKSAYVLSVLNQDLSYYDLNPTTELTVYLINDVKNIKQFINTACREIAHHVGASVSSLVLALYFDWKLALVGNSIVLLLILLIGVIGMGIAFAIQKEQDMNTLASSWAEQVLVSIKTVIAYEGQTVELQRYRDYTKKTNVYSIVKIVSLALLHFFYYLLFHTVFSICLWCGGELFITCNGATTTGSITAVLIMSMQCCIGIGYLIPPLTTLSKSSASLTNLQSAIDEKITDSVNNSIETAFNTDNIKGKVCLKNVAFSYPSRPNVRVLKEINMAVKPGQTMALIGTSGCGKSTILKLIPRLYPLSEGNIYIDGHDISEVSARKLKECIGIVPQEPILFNVSVAENIGYGKIGVTMDDIEAAAVTANAHDFISALPNGYDTVVGEGGSGLSGGQKQRIAIATALIKNPKILLLDEATSALDVKSENLVQQALDKAREGRTTIIIAHRLSTIKNADVIVAMDKGRIVETGTHSELMKNEGLYYNLVVNQTSNEKDDEESTDFQKLWRNTSRMKSYLHLRKTFHGFSRNYKNRLRETITKIRRIHSFASALSSTGYIGFHQLDRKESVKVDRIKVSHVGQLQLPNNGGNEIPKVAVVPKSTTTLRDFLSLIKKEWWWILLGLLSLCLIGMEIPLSFILLTQAINVFTQTNPDAITAGLVQYIVWYMVLGVVGGIIYFIAVAGLGGGASRLSRKLKIKCFETFLNEDPSFFDQKENDIGDLMSRLIDDPLEIERMFGTPIGLFAQGISAAVASIALGYYGSWVTGMILIPGYPILILSFFLEIKLGQRFENKASSEESNSLAIEAIENLPTVAYLGIAGQIKDKFDKMLETPSRYFRINAVVHALVYSISQSYILLASAVALSVSGYILEDTTAEDRPYSSSFNDIVLAIFTYLFTTTLLLREAFHSLPEFNRGLIAVSRMQNLLHRHDHMMENSTAGQHLQDGFNPEIQADSIFFSYPSNPERSILNGLDCEIKTGRSLALVGPSGSGKSTIISLIEKFYSPTSGTILLNGVDITELDTPWLRRQISLVAQEPVLFDVSIAENIRYGANYLDISDEEIQEAAKLANIHDFIINLPKGYDTVTGLKGTQISGGQKQRIAIARALIRNPKILLLDEATSALDSESERIVQETLDKAKEGRTTIIIAHRLSTIQNADCIAVLHKGRIIERGTHSELMDKRGDYYIMNAAANS